MTTATTEWARAQATTCTGTHTAVAAPQEAPREATTGAVPHQGLRRFQQEAPPRTAGREAVRAAQALLITAAGVPTAPDRHPAALTAPDHHPEAHTARDPHPAVHTAVAATVEAVTAAADRTAATAEAEAQEEADAEKLI